MTTNVTYTPWGWTKDVKELAEGVWRVSTPSHGGLKLSRERWDPFPPNCGTPCSRRPSPRRTARSPSSGRCSAWATTCEREMALKVAGYFDRYAPALPHLRDCPPGIHYHAVAYRGGFGTDPFGRFDTRIEAESFVGDAEMVRAYGKLKAVECSRTLPLCRAEGGRP